MRLIYSASRIFGAYLHYGLILEDTFDCISLRVCSKFTSMWFLQMLEVCMNVIAGSFGWFISNKSLHRPQKQFIINRVTQVLL